MSSRDSERREPRARRGSLANATLGGSPPGALQRQLRDFAVAATLAIIVATCAFVAVRNTELEARQTDLAVRTATALANGRVPLPTVHGAVIGPAVPSKKHPYLRRRMVQETAGWRELGVL